MRLIPYNPQGGGRALCVSYLPNIPREASIPRCTPCTYPGRLVYTWYTPREAYTRLYTRIHTQGGIYTVIYPGIHTREAYTRLYTRVHTTQGGILLLHTRVYSTQEAYPWYTPGYTPPG